MAKFIEKSKFKIKGRKIIEYALLLVFIYFSVVAIPTFAQGYEIWGKTWDEVPGNGIVDTSAL